MHDMEQNMDSKQEEKNWFQSIREMWLPVNPDDGPVAKTLKNSAFYLFGTLALLISVSLAAVVIMVV